MRKEFVHFPLAIRSGKAWYLDLISLSSPFLPPSLSQSLFLFLFLYFSLALASLPIFPSFLIVAGPLEVFPSSSPPFIPSTLVGEDEAGVFHSITVEPQFSHLSFEEMRAAHYRERQSGLLLFFSSSLLPSFPVHFSSLFFLFLLSSLFSPLLFSSHLPLFVSPLPFFVSPHLQSHGNPSHLE